MLWPPKPLARGTWSSQKTAYKICKSMGELQFNGPPLDQGGDLKGILQREGSVPLALFHSCYFFSLIFMFLEMFLRFLMIGAELKMSAELTGFKPRLSGRPNCMILSEAWLAGNRKCDF